MRNLLVYCLQLCTLIAHGQSVIHLYSGKAPGSENWTWKEQDLGGGNFRDVVDPTLTVFRPATPNGIAVIIAPGGAFHFLAFDHEGISVAKRLNEHGITAFVLKYRLAHEDPAHPYIMRMFQAKTNQEASRIMDSASAPVVPLMLQDGLTAVKHVRQQAAAYKIDPNKIGFMGFSAGGTVTMLVAYNGRDESRPDFAAPVYGYAGLVKDKTVPTSRIPLFVCAASDDNSVLPGNSVQFYANWLEAKQPAELHMYQKGGHGFGIKKQNLPVDTWLDRFTEWLFMQYPPKP